jgi:anti-anti-sigma factor
VPSADPFILLAPAEIDLATAPAFGEALDAVERDRPLLVDCAQVQFIDSSGLRALVLAYQARTEVGSSLRVINAPDVVRRLLEITALQHLLDGDHPA